MPRKAPAAEVERPVPTQESDAGVLGGDAAAPPESDAGAVLGGDAAAPPESDAAVEVDGDPVEVDGDPVEVELVEVVIAFDEEACRLRAFEISLSEEAGTPEENWLRAERELGGSPASAAEE
jgi:hypothetical protein